MYLYLHFFYYNLFYDIVLSCPPLTAPDNGDIDCSLGDDGTADCGDACIFTCGNGYVLSGSGGRICRDNNTWSGSVTSCLEGKSIAIYFSNYFQYAVCTNRLWLSTLSSYKVSTNYND